MIDSFMGEYRWLSNFGESLLNYNGHQYKNSESAYQDAKLITHDKRYEDTNGSEAKKLSKTLTHLTRPDWKQVNLAIMSEIIHAKFTQNKDIRIKLMNTYPQELIEGNNWQDHFWGVCNGAGLNWLGRILMAERVYWLDLMANKHKGVKNG